MKVVYNVLRCLLYWEFFVWLFSIFKDSLIIVFLIRLLYILECNLFEIENNKVIEVCVELLEYFYVCMFSFIL